MGWLDKILLGWSVGILNLERMAMSMLIEFEGKKYLVDRSPSNSVRIRQGKKRKMFYWLGNLKLYDEIPIPLDDELVRWGARKVEGRAVIKAQDYSKQDTLTVYVAVRDEDIISEKFFFGYVAEYGTAKILRHKEKTSRPETDGFVKKLM